MKKTIAIIGAFVALIACTKEAPVTEEPTQNENKEIKIDFKISRDNISDDTKATVKTGWADGDVVFVFFKGIAAPKYLELKYSTAEGWDKGAKTTITNEDLESDAAAADRKMTAVYLPYGSDFTVGDSEGSFTIKNASDEDYFGHFYYQESAAYEFDGSSLSGSISLLAARPDISGDKLVHFDISGGFTSGNTYVLNQDYMKRISLSSISSTGAIKKYIDPYNRLGRAIPGYYDEVNNIVSFSGVLDATGVGSTKKDFRFVIHDKTNGWAYSRVVANKAIEDNMFIGIGSLSSWGDPIKKPYFSVAPTKLVEFAPGNLVATITATTVVDEKTVPTAATWAFHTHQYDMIFTSAGSNTFEVDDKVDLFCWVGESSTALTGNVTKYGVSSSNTDADYGLNPDDNLMADWGTAIGGTWYTPSADEWRFVIGDRPGDYEHLGGFNSRSVDVRFAKANLFGTTTGLIILPDNYQHPVGVPELEVVNLINVTNQSTWLTKNRYTLDQWNSMETAGAVFLPTAGTRNGFSVTSMNTQARYWTSSHAIGSQGFAPETRARRLYWDSTSLLPIDEGEWDYRARGHSVRLIKPLN